MKIDDREWPTVWCPVCRARRLLRTDVMPTDKANSFDSMDIQCNTCDLVIATLHDAPPTPNAGE